MWSNQPQIPSRNYLPHYFSVVKILNSIQNSNLTCVRHRGFWCPFLIKESLKDSKHKEMGLEASTFYFFGL